MAFPKPHESDPDPLLQLLSKIVAMLSAVQGIPLDTEKQTGININSIGQLPRGVFDPRFNYTLETLAYALDVEERWVKEHLMYSRQAPFRREGNQVYFRGQDIDRWMAGNNQWDESNQPPGE